MMCVFRLPSSEEQGGSVVCISQQRRLEQVPHGHKGENQNIQKENVVLLFIYPIKDDGYVLFC